MKADYNEYRKDTGLISFDDGSTCPYRIIQSDRRTMALQVTKNGEVIVRMPGWQPLKDGHELIQKNRRWVYAHVAKVRKISEEKEPFHWSEGALVLLFGKHRTLRLEPDFTKKGFMVQDTEEELVIKGPFDKCGRLKKEVVIKEVMKGWYRQAAGTYLEEKAARWAVQMNVDYGRITIRDQATRWGSCSMKGNLNFNWRLVLLPDELADYVVVHELAHRIQMNHSIAFWKIVENEIPDYRLRRRKLKSYEDEVYQKY